jgi:hypothetical protein
VCSLSPQCGVATSVARAERVGVRGSARSNPIFESEMTAFV